MTTITGTAHFVSKADAIRYYQMQGIGMKGTQAKLEAGEIKIGKPTIKPGQKLQIIRDEGRYAISE